MLCCVGVLVSIETLAVLMVMGATLGSCVVTEEVVGPFDDTGVVLG